MILGNIDCVRVALTSQKAANVKLLDKLIFGNENPRLNRNKILNFEGFKFKKGDDAFENKVKEVKDMFTLTELIKISDILNISSESSKAEVVETIISCLCDFEILKTNIVNGEISEEESDSVQHEKSVLSENNESVLTENGKKENVLNTNNESEYVHENHILQTKSVLNNNIKHNLNVSSDDCSNYELKKVENISINFSDVQNMIPNFSGQCYENVLLWLNQFESVANLLRWSDLQKIIFAKRSLVGNALLFIRSEVDITSWEQLKNALTEEFAVDSNSADLHELLRKRRKKETETIQEYFFSMRELGNVGKIEDAALMQYIINGLNDRPENKLILYGCKNLREFRDKLKIYEKVKNDSVRPKYNSDKTKVNKKPDDYFERKGHNSSQNIKHCYNCGNKGHLSKFCMHKNKGLKCFKCQAFGHKASECLSLNTKPTVTNHVQTLNVIPRPNLKKTVRIGDMEINSIIDTGSQVTVFSKNVWEKLNIKELNPSDSTLSGFGKCEIKPLGFFKSDIEIDDFKCSANICVVENYTMPHDAIIGLDVLLLGETIITENGIVIKSKNRREDNQNKFSVLPVDVVFTENEIDVGNDIPRIMKDEIREIILNYKPNKTKSTNVEMKIVVKNEEPIFHSPRRLPFAERKIVEAQIKDWCEQGIVEPCSSEYSSPVVLVKKKDGSPRICIDYRKLNKVIIKDRFPLPLIEDVLDRLQESRVFSTIDLKNGFFHVDVSEESRKYTSFVTHEGEYQFLKVPFGLCNSPSVFQRFINTIFRPLVNAGIVLPYMDDIIILSANEEEGIERLKQVLDLASQYGLDINFRKSQFLKRKVVFLGHVVEKGCISPSTYKTKAVLNFPEPTNLKQIQSFLGLTGYFRKFIHNYSIIAKPLSDLLKKDSKFKFDDEQRNSFNKLKMLLSQTPVLGIYNPKYETELHADASMEGYGAILLQKSPDDNKFHPIYYMSRKTTDAEKKYSSYELEVLAIIEALKKFRVYLLGISFNIVTDCEAFQKTMEKRDLSTRVARWVLLLQEFNYTIEHRSGTKMPHVDALSRSPINIFPVVIDDILPKLKLAQDEDNEIKVIKELLKTSNYDNYCERNGILYKFVDGKDLLVVPESMQSEIIKNAHEKGHFGLKHTEKRLEDLYYIPKLKRKIEQIITNCVHCILINRKAGKQEGFLHPISKDELPLSTYHIDHLGPLESTHKNYKYILAVIDAFTKFVWLYPTKTTSSHETISKLEIQKYTFGNPTRIISDRGSAFTSQEFEEYCSKEGIQHHSVTTGLPRANGQVERLNRVIISVLSKLTIDNPSHWYKHVNEVQQTINCTYHRSIDTTPFELLFGTKMNTNCNDKLNELIESEFRNNFEKNREELRKDAKKQIYKIQEQNKKMYNLRRRDPKQYKVGDLVAIKRTQFGPHLKLKPKFLGPYKITKAKTNDTYEVTKEGSHEGPIKTTTCAEFLKRWAVD